MIAAAKETLYDNVKDIKQRFKKHTGANSGKKNMQEIAAILLSIEPRNMPIFVARDLGNLPPLDATHFDVVKILQEVQSVKQTVSMLCDSQTVLTELVNDKMANLHTSASRNMPERIQQPQQPAPDPIPSASSSSTNDFMVVDYTSCSDSEEPAPDLSDPVAFANAMQQTRHESGFIGDEARTSSPYRGYSDAVQHGRRGETTTYALQLMQGMISDQHGHRVILCMVLV